MNQVSQKGALGVRFYGQVPALHVAKPRVSKGQLSLVRHTSS